MPASQLGLARDAKTHLKALGVWPADVAGVVKADDSKADEGAAPVSHIPVFLHFSDLRKSSKGTHLQALSVWAADVAGVVEADDGKAGQGAAPVLDFHASVLRSAQADVARSSTPQGPRRLGG